MKVIIALLPTLIAGCGVVRGATKAGMKPILVSSVDRLVTEADPVLAESAIAANIKLIEGVVETFPDDVELLNMAAMARANYAFGFIQDELEALRFAYPDERDRAQVLLLRVQMSYQIGRNYAERALLANNDAWAEVLQDRRLETLSPEEFQAAVNQLEREDAPAAYWLAFNWGGTLQVALDPAQATQLPKIERLTARILELDERVFYDVGPHMLAGVFWGFRAPALGGQPEKALEHLEKAKALGRILLPDVLKAQFVYAQTEQQDKFQKTLKTVLETPLRPDRALLDTLAKIKACRLLANLDQFFLADPEPVPALCRRFPHKYPLRESEGAP